MVLEMAYHSEIGRSIPNFEIYLDIDKQLFVL